MNTSETPNKPFYEKPIIVIPAIIAFILFLVILNKFLVNRSIENGEYPNPSDTTKEYYVQTTDGIVPGSTFESEYSAETWFSKYSSNKVAFDQKYDDKKIDVLGTVADVKDEYGCSIVVMKGDNRPFDDIEFSNCPENNDKWLNEVTKLQVGELVHIRGAFDGSTTDFAMHLYKCHVINP